MAEDDDDEAFGDFAFAPFQSNSLISVPNSSAAPADEDEWGDFVEPPSQSKPSGTAVNGDHRSGNSASPATWMKPRGALPLSLFGDAEESGDLAVPGDFNREERNGGAEVVGSGLAGNGVLKSKSFSIADLYDRYSQTKHESRDLAVKDDSVVNGVYSSGNQASGEAAVVELKNAEFSFKSYMSDPSKEEDLFGGWTGEFNGIGSNLKTSPENVLMLGLDLDMNGEKQQLDGSNTAVGDEGDGDDGDEEWDFKDADSEFEAQDVNNNVGLMVQEVSESRPYSSGTGIGSTKSLDLFGTSNGSIDLFASSTEPVDFFANSSGISTTSQEVDVIGIPSSATPNGFTSDEHFIIGQSNVGGLLDYRADVGIEELDEDFGDFSAASAKTGAEPKELFINNILSPIEDAMQTPDGKIQEKDTNLNHHKGAIPLSIFGDEEPENGSSSDVQDFFFQQSIPAKRSDHIASSVNSINDMISNLYSQAEQTSSTNTEHNLIESQLNPSSVVSSSNLVDDGGDDDDDDNSWDFKDASEVRFDSEAPLTSTGDAYMSQSSKLKLDNYLDFYSKLKEELCFVVKHHIDRMKNAQGDANLFVDGVGAESFDSEFQLFCNEPEHMNFLHEEGALQDHHTRDSHLHEFAQVLLEPKFQRLESEYHLSQKLLIVENDLGSSMELIRHTKAMLKILNIGKLEEQKVYVSLWSEMISVCAQELRHGASIWNDAVMRHVQSQFLSEPQGMKFVLALGEIYRVVIVLGASAILFKPWILSSSVDPPSIYILLEECRAVWSTSGLEEALASVSAPTTLNDTSLFKSIKHILGLDELKLENYVFAEKESRCCLSLLTAGVVPDLKIVMWGNEQCFVTLANLWANLISRYPPNLPQLHLG
ncbi:uncharacterized protein LOC130985005 isoform X2 [Salvia miltiorrhiza]|uniref:uncharacterized protein LOC130985005 isoform X2 n=1 Tax=Salvia miltiorrhiza TaxID=226208 RepID=UPI0025AD40F8|nr:uncharacterized protein LOC130985005 isoform X2 [Salvia miltiorrhiza]